MSRNSLYLSGLIVVTALALHGQTQPPTTGAQYWSTSSSLDCSSLLYNTPVPITNAAGTTIGYSCLVSGTFLYFAAGGGWGSAIRVAAPASAPVGVDYTFYDVNGNAVSLDTTGSLTQSSSDVNFALNTNQPSEIDLAGATGNGPSYNSTAVGTVYAEFLCPDSTTCLNVLPQLIYSNLPTHPWALSVPITWDDNVWTQWSAEGIDDGIGVHTVSLAIYNEDTQATSYKVSVYDSSGNLAGTGTTPSVPPLQNLGNGSYGEGGVFAASLRSIVPTLPSGTFKVYIDGGSLFSAAEVLQFYGPTATTLQVAYDGTEADLAPTSRTAAPARLNARRRAAPASMPLFRPLPK